MKIKYKVFLDEEVQKVIKYGQVNKMARIITELYNKNYPYLFINDNTNTKMTYDSYRHRFAKLMKTLNLNHTVHNTRHTFATKCEEIGISLDE